MGVVMCGFVGIVHFDPEDSVDVTHIHRMQAAIRNRGPDDEGTYVDGNLTFGFNRLSIIDVAGGHQPMSNEDGSVWLVCNGEIYNFGDLRNELKARGHVFRSRSDSETIVHAWEEFGPDCVNRLRGMFAFAVWDRRRKTLFLARDRLGIKPLYYYQDHRRLIFASELKALLAAPDVPREVNEDALAEYLEHRYVIGPDTMAKGVCKLLPGHSLTVRRDDVSCNKYWDVPLEAPREVSDEGALEKASDLFDEVVRSHLVSDVPLGAFLSGGLDSSSIVALMHRNGVRQIETFSVGYDSPESELRYARLVASHFETRHHECLLTPSMFRDSIPRMIWALDEPVGDEAAVPLFHVAEMARKNVTVALSGEGADEILAGYPIYRRMLGIDRANRLPLLGSIAASAAVLLPEGKLRKNLDLLGRPLEERYGGVSRVFSRDQIHRMVGAGALPTPAGIEAAFSRTQGMDPLTRMTYLDLKTWLPDDLLVKADRMSMANSLELRVPFLDHAVVEFAARLPQRFKIRNGKGKSLLRTIAEPLLPREILERPKAGFPIPIGRWLRNELREFTRDTLLSRGGPCESFFSRSEIQDLLDLSDRRDLAGHVYSLLVFDQWHRTVLRSDEHPGGFEEDDSRRQVASVAGVPS